MSTGRTSWWACDAAEHDRELVVELGEEFGPAGHAVARVLKDLAQQQREPAGNVRTGFRALAGKTHLAVQAGGGAEARALARRIVEYAAEIGYLDDLKIDDDGRRFICRVSGWTADQTRGRETLKKAGARAAKAADDPPDASPEPGTAATVVPANGDTSPVCPPTRPDQTREKTPLTPRTAGGTGDRRPVRSGGGRRRDLERFEQQIGETASRLFPDPPDEAATRGHVELALRQGASDDDEIRRFVDEVQMTGRMPTPDSWRTAA